MLFTAVKNADSSLSAAMKKELHELRLILDSRIA
jgi:hypothetical protein